jgi:hypothetical protein
MFATADWPQFIRGLIAAQNAGSGAVASFTFTTIANTFWGLEAVSRLERYASLAAAFLLTRISSSFFSPGNQRFFDGRLSLSRASLGGPPSRRHKTPGEQGSELTSAP